MELALQPGDVLLYAGKTVFSKLIKIKTWSKFSHVEVYVDNGESVASRDGIGVGLYEIRTDDLRAILRPREEFRILDALKWFATVDGQKYDWTGLLAFTWAKWQGRENNKQFCSEFATRFLRAGGVDPFNGYDADGIAPGEFPKSPAFDILWMAK